MNECISLYTYKYMQYYKIYSCMLLYMCNTRRYILLFPHIYMYIYICNTTRYIPMKSAIFWGITRRLVVIVYRRFGTTYRSHLHGQESGVRFSETSVNNYHTTPRNTPEDRASRRKPEINVIFLCFTIGLYVQH
jgi:hypothetical protein